MRKRANFALAVLGFADRDEVDPSVIVVVEGGNTEDAGPIGLGQWDLIEVFALLLRQRVRPRAASWVSEVHPIVMVEIEHCGRDGAGHGRGHGSRAGNLPSRGFSKMTVSLPCDPPGRQPCRCCS